MRLVADSSSSWEARTLERTRDYCDPSLEQRRVPRTFWGSIEPGVVDVRSNIERVVTNFDPDGCVVRIDLVDAARLNTKDTGARRASVAINPGLQCADGFVRALARGWLMGAC